MRKMLVTSVVLVLVACGAKVDKGTRPLYEVLTQQEQGGAQVRFFEILTEEKEINMLLGDENLKDKIKPADINTANFVILNLGEQTSGGHTVAVEKVEELPDKIVITVKESHPGPGEMATSVMSYPYAIVRVNSKKPIEIKD
ncbi:protease complex subunit PrcB family protein [Flavobacterium caeni]|uniref:PrcB C-terminal n=1 Tax=Flavobacterium caeni TaxID=490189 RepID=A0A1G5DAX3_9FLAO|nr:protease complex subunit PrcB family protein [Flavobacterium caeni]SCY11766.1 PrcB C-terminal [Flavobacterium caeni]